MVNVRAVVANVFVVSAVMVVVASSWQGPCLWRSKCKRNLRRTTNGGASEFAPLVVVGAVVTEVIVVAVVVEDPDTKKAWKTRKAWKARMLQKTHAEALKLSRLNLVDLAEELRELVALDHRLRLLPELREQREELLQRQLAAAVLFRATRLKSNEAPEVLQYQITVTYQNLKIFDQGLTQALNYSLKSRT